jgi:hypothetical protein
LRSPIICPKCETEFVTVVTGRGSRSKAAAPVPAAEQAKPEIEKKENLDLLAAEEDIPDDSGLGILDDDDDDDDLIEDTSDLATEDSVLDGMGGNPQKTDDLTE